MKEKLATTRNITNGGRSGSLKASSPHQGLQRLKGMCFGIRQWPYAKTLGTMRLLPAIGQLNT
jgi:hypothetical protein